ncbi:hypothetical protein ACFE04_015448 [Oxalis oulophora]
MENRCREEWSGKAEKKFIPVCRLGIGTDKIFVLGNEERKAPPPRIRQVSTKTLILTNSCSWPPRALHLVCLPQPELPPRRDLVHPPVCGKSWHQLQLSGIDFLQTRHQGSNY